MLIKGARIAVALATILPAVAYFFGSRFIFFPTNDRSDHAAATLGPRWQVEAIDTGGRTIRGVVRPPERKEAPWLLYFGGNAAPITGNAQIADWMRGTADVGLATFAYRGYDDTPGTPSESALLTDAQLVAAHLRQRYAIDPARLIIVGQSLGTGVAAATAMDLCLHGTPPRKLVLISPYRSMAARFDDATWPFPVGWALSHPFRTDERLAHVTCPILVVHGTNDEVISVRHGRTLAAMYPQRIRYREVPQAGHNDIHDAIEPHSLIADALLP